MYRVFYEAETQSLNNVQTNWLNPAVKEFGWGMAVSPIFPVTDCDPRRCRKF